MRHGIWSLSKLSCHLLTEQGNESAMIRIHYSLSNQVVVITSAIRQSLNQVESQESTAVLSFIIFLAMNSRSAFRRPSVTEADMPHLACDVDYANEIMDVVTSHNKFLSKLLAHQSALNQNLGIRKAAKNSSATGSTQNKTLQLPKKIRTLQVPEKKRATYLDLVQAKNTIGSPQEWEPFFPNQHVEIIVRNDTRPKSPPTSQKAKEERRSPSFEMEEVQQQKNLVATEQKTMKKKQTQTKNMVKNFSKAIFYFIKKNKEMRQRVLSSFNIEEQDFMKVFQELSGHIHSILQLRSLWVEGENPYDKVFRILSYQYLRKGCLQRTFNSRIENYLVHLKYRKVLIEALKQPHQLTSLKQN